MLYKFLTLSSKSLIHKLAFDEAGMTNRNEYWSGNEATEFNPTLSLFSHLTWGTSLNCKMRLLD